MIQLNLTTDACTSYAEFYGWNEDSDKTCEQFVTDKLLEKITNDLVEQRNRRAIAAVQDQPVTVTEG